MPESKELGVKVRIYFNMTRTIMKKYSLWHAKSQNSFNKYTHLHVLECELTYFSDIKCLIYRIKKRREKF